MVYTIPQFTDPEGGTSLLIDHTVPILLFCVLFGLSMDYEVFLLSRIREEWLRTQDNRWAVAYGLEKIGIISQSRREKLSCYQSTCFTKQSS